MIENLFGCPVCSTTVFHAYILPVWKRWLPVLCVLWCWVGKQESGGAQCVLVCQNLVHVSLDQQGQAIITPDMVAQHPYNPNLCSPTDPAFFEVTLSTANGQPIPTSPMVTCAHVGTTLTAKVRHIPSGNLCWGSIRVEDKLPPVLVCTDKMLSCNLQNFDPNSPHIGFPGATDNCDADVSLSFTDTFTDVPCHQTVNGMHLSAYITRLWTAKDDAHNTSSCVQHLFLLRKTLSDVVFPPNRDGIQAPALDCSQTNFSPQVTGFPTIDGRRIDGFCELSYHFNDQVIPTCGASGRVILRTWTVLDWCTRQIGTHLQTIEVRDNTPPTIFCPPDLTVATQAFTCSASVALPAAGVFDDCSLPITVTITAPTGSWQGNGGQMVVFPVGTHSLKYTARDACGNENSCLTRITVEDRAAPNVVCLHNMVVGLNNTGTANVPAKAFDLGSFDNCTPKNQLVFTARRVQDAHFDSKIRFDCTHVPVLQQVVVRVTDAAGNFNECMAQVDVQDKTPPSMTCPANLSVNCDVFTVSDLSSYGTATATDNCSAVVLAELAATVQLSACNVGTVIRRFRATDAGGFSSTCSQRISVVNQQAWNGSQNIVWPADYQHKACATSPHSLLPDSLPVGFNFPKFSGQSACNAVAWSFDDQIFYLNAPACFKIFRRWKVIDQCRYDINQPNGAGQWTHTQVIMVMDTQAPQFVLPPAEIAVSLGDHCRARVELPRLSVVDCSPNQQLSVTSTLGQGFGPFQHVAAGDYWATYRATDGCGNVATHTMKIVVKDDKAPTVICHNGLSINLMQPGGMVSIWAKDFNAGSFDNCTAPEHLKFSFSQNPGDTGMIFNCQQVGVHVVNIWATDAAGNSSYCSTFVSVQDPFKNCGQTTAQIAGKIATESARPVAGVRLHLTGTNALPPLVTDSSGRFQIGGLPINIDYTLTPSKNDDWLNGVTTYDLLLISRHILGISPFNSPYQLIAADVNHSKSITANDIVTLRKLILGIIDTLPAGKSWRFIDADWQFDDPKQPFLKNFPEMKTFSAMQPSGGISDFVAVKLGDLNGSATAHRNAPYNVLRPTSAPVESRQETLPLTFFIENSKVFAGQRLAVPVRVQNFDGIEGYQFQIGFDTLALELTHVSDFGVENMSVNNFAFFRGLGTLAANWENPYAKPFPNENQLFTLHFVVWKDGWLADFFQFRKHAADTGRRPLFLQNEAYRSGVSVPLYFEFTGESADLTAETGIEWVVFPNPFIERTNMRITLPRRAATARLRVVDLDGRFIFEKPLENSSGATQTYVLEIQRNIFPRTGIFVACLEVAGEVITRRIVVY